MVGIYKITNNINGKIYIGQSNNIKRRFSEHKRFGKKGVSVDWAIEKYGVENFTFEVLEECSLEKLNDREIYWIVHFNCIKEGYNISIGGQNHSKGEENPRAKLTEEDVVKIRKAYAEKKRRRKDVYNDFKDKISFHTFAGIWDGRSWNYIMPEVFTDENKEYYSKKSTCGELSTEAKFTNEEVINLRQRYVNETARQIYEDYKTRCSYNTLQSILWGRYYKNLPVYKKKTREWVNK